jgi:glycosyltransferase involved in cell wall biosynthesis
MLITLEVTRLTERFVRRMDPTGVDRVTLAYVRQALENNLGADRPVRALLRLGGLSGIFSRRASQELFDILLQGHRHASARMIRLLPLGICSCLFNGNGKRDLLIYTAHQQVETPSLWRNLRWHGLSPVFFLHDVIPMTHPHFSRAGEDHKHRQRLARMQQGVGVIMNSQDTAARWQEFVQMQVQPQSQAGRPPVDVCVAKLGIRNIDAIKNIAKNPIFFPTNGLNDPQNAVPYFVCLGTVEPRKNHALLLQVWRQLLSKYPAHSVPQLRVIGRSGWGCESIEAQLQDASWHKGRVQWLTDCSDAQLAQQLAGAQALLFPSHTEGFGLPLAEALQAGVPALASDLLVFREFASDVPEYLPLTNAQAWFEAVEMYAQPSHPKRQAQLHRLQAWQAPSWQQHFEQVTPWLEQLWRRHCA